MSKIIGLGVLVIFLSFILLYFFNNSVTKLATFTSLSKGNVVVPIPTSASPSTSRYALGIWVYVNSWTMNNSNKMIYELPGIVSLYLDTTKPVLRASFSTGDIIEITQNFAIQKWSYVTISVDNTYVDLYIDGKLIKSIKLSATQSNSTDHNVYIGGKSASMNDINIATFKRWINPLSPQEVWNEYMKGNGGIGNMFNHYGVNVNLLKDNVSTSTFKLF
jgi:hypothetical protein